MPSKPKSQNVTELWWAVRDKPVQLNIDIWCPVHGMHVTVLERNEQNGRRLICGACRREASNRAVS